MKRLINNKKILIILGIIIIIILAIILVLLFTNRNSLTNNPKSSEIEEIIKKLDGAYSTCRVTEDNDPNGNLNKQGGYTGAIYFRLKQVDEAVKNEAIKDYGKDFVNNGNWENPYDDYKDTCNAGTSAGGQIEIYKNKSDANKRNKYLETLDGFLSGGYHIVEDTLVIRISDDLTATEQKEIAQQIINLLNK